MAWAVREARWLAPPENRWVNTQRAAIGSWRGDGGHMSRNRRSESFVSLSTAAGGRFALRSHRAWLLLLALVGVIAAGAPPASAAGMADQSYDPASPDM